MSLSSKLLIVMVAASAGLALACGPTAPSNVEGGVTSDPSSSGAEASGTEVSTTETETETDTETETETDEGCFFEDCGGDMLGELPDCDPYIQDCPEGEKCVPYSPNPKQPLSSWTCVQIIGQVPAGEPCVVEPGNPPIDDCGQDNYCTGARPLEGDGEWSGICSPFCSGDANDPSCPAGHACIDTEFEPGPEYCAALCNPLLQDCGPGSLCQFSGARFECMAELEQLPTGSACAQINECVAGDVCAVASALNCEADNCCARYCNLDEGNGPCQAIDPDYVCTPFFEQGWPGDPSPLDLVGACVLEGA